LSSKLYVGNLPFGVSEEDLKKLFSEAGEVQSLKIIMDPYSGRPRGFGFVEMTSKAEAEKAILLLNGRTLTDRALIVSEARPKKKRGGEFRGRRDSNR
jgi:cold-inducible RNA-binding protein